MQNDIKQLKFAIIIPAYNEEKFISDCLDSLVNQSLKPKSIIVVDDSSTDDTPKIIKAFQKEYSFIKYVFNSSANFHEPGHKVVKAFNRGLKNLNINDYDIVCKFDADLIFPPNYLNKINQFFFKDKTLGLCGGNCSVLKKDKWEKENVTNNDHVRGAIKAYRVKAFKDIEGLSSQMGWDTADEFKLRFNKWKIKVVSNLSVKHLKPTAIAYQDVYFEKQGQVFYALRYSYWLAFLAALKISTQRNQLFKFLIVLKSYNKFKAQKHDYLLTVAEGKFLRQYRWKQIFKKLKL